MDNASPTSSFLARNEFLLRRLHSLSGLIPVGAYMVVHLIVNASVLNSVATFQNAVFNIHSLGRALLLVEWVFIFIPILFHAIFGVIIIQGGLPNHGTYRYGGNFRYSMQRATGMIAFVFILYHVGHMHGWFHFEPWLDMMKNIGGARFSPYNAASTAAAALQGSILAQLAYAIGVLACVFHLANGLWTMGITWGLWVTPPAQRWAGYVCLAFGIGLGAVGLSSIGGLLGVDVPQARAVEDRLYEARVETGEVLPDEHKRFHTDEHDVAQGDQEAHQ